MSASADYELADLMVGACAEAWRGEGEVLATGIGAIPRLAAGLAKLTHSPQILMNDGEAYLQEEPVPLGASAAERPAPAGWIPYRRVFECLWGGRRHAMTMPTQIDRFGQSNISCVGDYRQPKVQLLGARGFPGNTVMHPNSMCVPSHGRRVFVEGEVDMVAGAGYNPGRWPDGTPRVDLRLIVSDLCVMDFGGPDHAIRVTSLHPGVSFEQVQEATGFELARSDRLAETPAPTAEQLELLNRLDPHGQRHSIVPPR